MRHALTYAKLFGFQKRKLSVHRWRTPCLQIVEVLENCVSLGGVSWKDSHVSRAVRGEQSLTALDLSLDSRRVLRTLRHYASVLMQRILSITHGFREQLGANFGSRTLSVAL